MHKSFAIAWGNSGSHDFSANIDYQLIYAERALHNKGEKVKYIDEEFFYEMTILVAGDLDTHLVLDNRMRKLTQLRMVVVM